MVNGVHCLLCTLSVDGHLYHPPPSSPSKLPIWICLLIPSPLLLKWDASLSLSWVRSWTFLLFPQYRTLLFSLCASEGNFSLSLFIFSYVHTFLPLFRGNCVRERVQRPPLTTIGTTLGLSGWRIRIFIENILSPLCSFWQTYSTRSPTEGSRTTKNLWFLPSSTP